MNFKKLKQKLDKANATAFRQTEMRTHFEELYQVALSEFKFKNSQNDSITSLLNEVQVLINKWVKKELINKVIENWKERIVLDISIHYEIECGGIKGFNNK